MSLYLKVSNSLEQLCNELCISFKNIELGVFKPYRIVTQTQGMNIWLQLQIAQKFGIAANIEFIQPNDVVFKLYKILGGKKEEQLTRENLIWLLYHLLGTESFEKRFKEHAVYLNGVASERDNKRLGLAEKIADLFDQYQIYRQEIIQQWNNADPNDKNIDWQAWLWINAKNKASKSLPDKTVVSEFILNEIKNPEHFEKIKHEMPHVFLFGLSIITKYHIAILYELSKITDISLYILNPAPDIYWQDDKTEKDLAIWRSKKIKNTESQIIGNPLLNGWGKVLQNTFRLLFRNDIAINNYEVIGEEIPQNDTLLHIIQNDIFHNRTNDRLPITKQNLEDESITIHSNYTIAREVQTLYHYLVHLIDKKGAQLSPRDIVVMVTDINKYAPFIKAVLDNAPYPFRYNISDMSQHYGDTINHALIQILNLNEDNFTSENVLQLLEFSHIKKKFGIADIEKIRALISAANIRFGIEGNNEDDTNLVSWIYGLKRIMFGICISGEPLVEYNNEKFYPIDITEGVESFEAVNFVYFIETLIDSINKRKGNKNFNQWIGYIEQTIHNLLFIPDEENSDNEYRDLIQTVRNLRQTEEIAQEDIAYPICCKYISNKLIQEKKNSVFIRSGITFCSLIPMRSIPFKVIALLGMNHDAFPRKESNLSFNLITQKHELGDRNIKDNDKHLFLETLLSAKEYLFISYLGKSVADNKPLPASVLVEELIDYVQAGVNDENINAETLLLTQHPLHHNSRKYNNDNPKLYCYDNAANETTNIFLIQKTEPEKYIPETINWREIIGFVKNGPKTYYTKIFDIYYDNDKYSLPETENFSFDNLESFFCKQEIIKSNNEHERNILQQRLLLTGRLPLKNVGIRLFNDEVESIKSILDKKNKLTEGKQFYIHPITLKSNGMQIQTTIDNIYDRTYIFPCFSKNAIKYKMEAYLNFLLLRATNIVDEIYFLHDGEIYKFNSNISESAAQNEIDKLVNIYLSGLESPYPVCAELYKDLIDVENLPENYLVTKLENEINNYYYPLSDKYILQAYSEGVFNHIESLEKFKTLFEIAIKPVSGFNAEA